MIRIRSTTATIAKSNADPGISAVLTRYHPNSTAPDPPMFTKTLCQSSLYTAFPSQEQRSWSPFVVSHIHVVFFLCVGLGDDEF